MRGLFLVLALLFSFNSFAARGVFQKNNIDQMTVNNVEFKTACALGIVDGCRIIRKFGINPGLQSGVKRDIWDFGDSAAGNVDYTYPADGTAPINTISSSSNLDTQKIKITGLDIDGVEREQEVTLNGQIKVPLGVSLFRSYRMESLQVANTADRSLGFNGNIYLYEDTGIVLGVPTDASKVRAYIYDGNNQTQMLVYTIPKGFIGLFIGSSAKMSRKTGAAIVYQGWIRIYGSVFRLIDTSAIVSTVTGAYTTPIWGPTIVPELTDIVICAESDTNNVGIAGEFAIMLFDKEKWKL